MVLQKQPEKTKESALSENTAWVMNKLLQTVMTAGTGTSYKLSGIQCFGKTGTTTDDKDRWFMGGTPDFVAGVWYGYDQPKEIYYGLSGNPSGTLWKTVMSAVYDKLDSDQYKTKFEEPEGIVKRSYCPLLWQVAQRKTGVYGWYDVNNLPGNCSGGHGYSTGGSSAPAATAIPAVPARPPLRQTARIPQPPAARPPQPRSRRPLHRQSQSPPRPMRATTNERHPLYRCAPL